MDRNALIWYDHVERMVKKIGCIYRAKFNGSRARETSKLRWMDSLNISVERKGVNIKYVEKIVLHYKVKST
jgi:hypothetical protein